MNNSYESKILIWKINKAPKTVFHSRELFLTCYFRHLKEIFQKAGIEVTRENKQEVDKLIQQIVKTEHKNCPETWKEVKKHITEDEAGFAAKLREAWKKRS